MTATGWGQFDKSLVEGSRCRLSTPGGARPREHHRAPRGWQGRSGGIQPWPQSFVCLACRCRLCSSGRRRQWGSGGERGLRLPAVTAAATAPTSRPLSWTWEPRLLTPVLAPSSDCLKRKYSLLSTSVLTTKRDFPPIPTGSPILCGVYVSGLRLSPVLTPSAWSWCQIP